MLLFVFLLGWFQKINTDLTTIQKCHYFPSIRQFESWRKSEIMRIKFSRHGLNFIAFILKYKFKEFIVTSRHLRRKPITDCNLPSQKHDG